MKKLRLLTGDRPTGRLHIGHYAGSIRNRVEMQNSGRYDPFIFIADVQALTDNAENPKKIQDSVKELMLDYLSCGLDPQKSTLFIQSQVPELFEISSYFLNLVSLSRLQRNPTIKEEIKQRGFEKSIPAGFLTYPVSQAADILAFDSDVVPVGDDQLPMIEQTNEIVKSFNRIYGETFKETTAVLPDNKLARRVPGIDGATKMSKSAGNCIYLSDRAEVVKQKVMQMYTDPNHLRVEDKGDTKNNVVFKYLEVFAKDQVKVKEMKTHYEKGGLGDVVCKKYLIEVLEEILSPIRTRRAELEKNMDYVNDVFKKGSEKARVVATDTLKKIRKAMQLNYFN